MYNMQFLSVDFYLAGSHQSPHTEQRALGKQNKKFNNNNKKQQSTMTKRVPKNGPVNVVA
jgi:NADH:ubiquinone oxidoreductase subunit B-like Fe-S oxidoreductase